MDNQTEAAVETGAGEKRPSSPAGKFVGGVAGGAAAMHFTNRHLVNKGIKDVLNGKEEPKGLKESVDKVLGAQTPEAKAALEANQSLVDGLEKVTADKVKSVKFIKDPKNEKLFHAEVSLVGGGKHTVTGIKDLPKDVKVDTLVDKAKFKEIIEGEKSLIGQKVKAAKDAVSVAGKSTEAATSKGVLDVFKNLEKEKKQITSIEFVAESAKEGQKAVHNMDVTVGKDVYTFFGVDLPKDAKVGEKIVGDKLKPLIEGEKSVLKKEMAGVEKSVIGAVKEAEKMNGFAGGIKKLGNGGKATVAIATVAGIGVGAAILNAVFRPKASHVERLEQKNAEQGMARA